MAHNPNDADPIRRLIGMASGPIPPIPQIDYGVELAKPPSPQPLIDYAGVILQRMQESVDSEIAACIANARLTVAQMSTCVQNAIDTIIGVNNGILSTLGDSANEAISHFRSSAWEYAASLGIMPNNAVNVSPRTIASLRQSDPIGTQGNQSPGQAVPSPLQSQSQSVGVQPIGPAPALQYIPPSAIPSPQITPTIGVIPPGPIPAIQQIPGEPIPPIGIQQTTLAFAGLCTGGPNPQVLFRRVNASNVTVGNELFFADGSLWGTFNAAMPLSSQGLFPTDEHGNCPTPNTILPPPPPPPIWVPPPPPPPPIGIQPPPVQPPPCPEVPVVRVEACRTYTVLEDIARGQLTDENVRLNSYFGQIASAITSAQTLQEASIAVAAIIPPFSDDDVSGDFYSIPDQLIGGIS